MVEIETRIAVLEQTYRNLEKRMDTIESKLDKMNEEFTRTNKAMINVIIGSAGTVVGGLLSTIVVILIAFT